MDLGDLERINLIALKNELNAVSKEIFGFEGKGERWSSG